MSGELLVRSPGMLSLVQDSGRAGYQRYGVSVSGAADSESLVIGNRLVGNDESQAGIEVTFGGAEFEFQQDTIAAVTGADLQPSLDGTPVLNWESFLAPAGSILRLASPVSGMRAYIAVAGGTATDPVLGSRSTHVSSKLGGLDGGALSAGAILPVGDPAGGSQAGLLFPTALRRKYESETVVRLIAGPHSVQFSEAGLDQLYSSVYTVSDTSDRQGLRLDGPLLETAEGRYDIVSDAVVSGTVQVPADGKPIVLMSDRQTTGGYVSPGAVASVDLPLLAQAPPGSTLRFRKCEVSEAQLLMRERWRNVLNANLSTGLVHLHSEFSVAGVPQDVSISLHPGSLPVAGGGLASVKVNGLLRTVRVEELD